MSVLPTNGICVPLSTRVPRKPGTKQINTLIEQFQRVTLALITTTNFQLLQTLAEVPPDQLMNCKKMSSSKDYGHMTLKHRFSYDKLNSVEPV